MRTSRRVGRRRGLAIAASVLLAGTALAVATIPTLARAAAAIVTVTPIANQNTTPLGSVVDLPIAASDTDTAGLPLTFTSTALPAGLTLTQVDETDAAITGTVTAPFDAPVTVTATDANGVVGTATFDWTAENLIAVTSPGTQSTKVETAVDLPIDATDNAGATATLTYSGGGTLPPGLAINPATGVISGIVTTTGTYPVTITASDGTGSPDGTATFTWKVAANVLTVIAPKAKSSYLGVKVSLQPAVTDSDKVEKTFTWTATALPRGLTISKSGLISGRPTKVGTSKTVVTAKDATGSAGSATISWKVTGAVEIVDLTPKVKTTTVGQGADIQFAARDAVPGDKQSFSAAGLPPGMALSQKPFLLWGWPTKAGRYTVTIHEKGSLGTSDTMAFKLAVQAAPDTGAAGQIHLAFDGKCLQDPANKTSNGAKVEITNCISGSTENWTLASDGTIRANGHCLDISGTSGYSGKTVVLWSCDGSPRELWTQGTKGLIVNPASGVCLIDPGASTRNGALPATGRCAVKPAGQWTLPAQPVLASEAGFCADDFHSLGYNGSEVDMYGCNGTPGQTWSFEPDGTIRQSQYPSVCLTDNSTLGKTGVKLTLWLCQPDDRHQQWSVAQAGGLSSEVSIGGVCLAIPSLAGRGTDSLVTAKCGKTNPVALWHIA